MQLAATFSDAAEREGFTEWAAQLGVDKQEIAELAISVYAADIERLDTLLSIYRSEPVALHGGPFNGQKVKVHPDAFQYGIRFGEDNNSLATYVLTEGEGWQFTAQHRVV